MPTLSCPADASFCSAARLGVPEGATGKFSSPLTKEIATNAMEIARVIIPDSIAQGPLAAKRARFFACAIGWFESGYGIYADTFLVVNDAGKTVPSYNWGAVNWSDTFAAGLNAYQFVSKDVDDTGKPTAPVRPAFSGDDARTNGFRYFMRAWMNGKSDVADAASDGDVVALARAMYAHGYYGGSGKSKETRIHNYALAISRTVRQLERTLGEDSGIHDQSPPFPWLMVGGVAIVGGAVWLWTTRSRSGGRR